MQKYVTRRQTTHTKRTHTHKTKKKEQKKKDKGKENKQTKNTLHNEDSRKKEIPIRRYHRAWDNRFNYSQLFQPTHASPVTKTAA